MEATKVILIILTILIVGPLVFLGSCLSASGTFGDALYMSGIGYNTTIPLISVLCLALAIFVCYLIIKKIKKSK
jgi:hypothetical protein